jgi:hypothetical protein
MTIIDLLFFLPLWLLAVVLIVFLFGFALVGLWLARRWLLPPMRLRHEDAYYAAAWCSPRCCSMAWSPP